MVSRLLTRDRLLGNADISRDGLVLNLPLYDTNLQESSFRSMDTKGHLTTVTGALWTPQGRTFDGIDDYINIANNPWSSLTLGAVGVWFYIPSDVTFPVGGGGQTFRYVLGASAHDAGVGGKLCFRILSDGSDLWVTDTDASSNSNPAGTWLWGQWYQVFIVWDGTNVIMYKNGAVLSTVAYTGGSGSGASQDKLGIAWDGNPHYGKIGEVLAYNRVPSASEVMNNYLATRWRYQ